MRTLFLLAGAGMMLALGAPAAADAKPGKGKGNQAQVMKAKPVTAKGAAIKPANANKKSWLTACPKGLVWRGPSCVPVGHQGRVLAVGSRVPPGWSYTPWGAVPMELRSGLDPNYRHVYRDGFIYVVDPRTNLITSVINAGL